MKRNTKAKTLRKGLILTFLFVGFLAIVESNMNNCAGAATCDEEYAEYLSADNAYYTARVSYFNGSPQTCSEECIGSTNPNCISDCQIRRQTALGQAEIELFDEAVETCTPLTVDQCSLARGRAEQCLLQFDYTQYTDPDEAMAVYAEYSACREASKVDSCQ